jgi:hypothetical protein
VKLSEIPALGQSGILAWDLVRYIALCRWGYLAGYLTQTSQNDCLIGREFWSLQQTQKYSERYRSIFERFMQDPNSPWNVNPWAMDLGVAAPLRITSK